MSSPFLKEYGTDISPSPLFNPPTKFKKSSKQVQDHRDAPSKQEHRKRGLNPFLDDILPSRVELTPASAKLPAGKLANRKQPPLDFKEQSRSLQAVGSFRSRSRPQARLETLSSAQIWILFLLPALLSLLVHCTLLPIVTKRQLIGTPQSVGSCLVVDHVVMNATSFVEASLNFPIAILQDSSNSTSWLNWSDHNISLQATLLSGSDIVDDSSVDLGWYINLQSNLTEAIQLNGILVVPLFFHSLSDQISVRPSVLRVSACSSCELCVQLIQNASYVEIGSLNQAYSMQRRFIMLFFGLLIFLFLVFQTISFVISVWCDPSPDTYLTRIPTSRWYSFCLILSSTLVLFPWDTLRGISASLSACLQGLGFTGILFSIFVLIDDLKFSRGQLLLLDSDESSERSADGHQDSTRWHTTPPAACNQSSSHWTKPQLPSTQPKPQSSVTQSVLVSDLDPHSVLTGNHPLSGQFVENMLSTSLSFVLSEVVLVGSILYLPTSSLQYLCYSFFIRLVVYFYWVVKICKAHLVSSAYLAKTSLFQSKFRKVFHFYLIFQIRMLCCFVVMFAVSSVESFGWRLVLRSLFALVSDPSKQSLEFMYLIFRFEFGTIILSGLSSSILVLLGTTCFCIYWSVLPPVPMVGSGDIDDWGGSHSFVGLERNHSAGSTGTSEPMNLFCLETACVLLEMSYQTYFSDPKSQGESDSSPLHSEVIQSIPKISIDVKRLGYVLHSTFEDKDSCTFGMACFSHEYNRIVISFRGSVAGNILTDLSFTQCLLPDMNIGGHFLDRIVNVGRSLSGEAIPFKVSDSGKYFSDEGSLGWKDIVSVCPVVNNALPRVHLGFWTAYCSIREQFLCSFLGCLLHFAHTPPGCGHGVGSGDHLNSLHVHFCGHSLGGALASLASLDVKVNFKLILAAVGWARSHPTVSTFTFGSPRVGNREFTKRCKLHVDHMYRVEVDGDIVCGIPHFLGLYKHCGVQVVVDAEETGNLIIHPTTVEKQLLLRSAASFENHSLSKYRVCLESCFEPAEMRVYLERESRHFSV